jgi:hypothetical protein
VNASPRQQAGLTLALLMRPFAVEWIEQQSKPRSLKTTRSVAA